MTTNVAERLQAIRARMHSACLRARRDPTDVTLVGAGKRQDDERLRAALAAGLTDFGENIVQEAERHRELLRDEGLTWHLIGPLQSNKARKAVQLFDWIHSVDRLKIARRLDREAETAGRQINAMAEVNLGSEPTKHGFAPEELSTAAEELLGFAHLRIVGLMAIPPPADTAEEARGWFRRLRELRDQLFPSSSKSAGLLSMGMSADFEIAIEEGATHIRVGTDLFGPRTPRSSAHAPLVHRYLAT